MLRRQTWGVSTSRGKLEDRWRRLLDGRLRREEVAERATEEARQATDDMMVAIGLQLLANLDLRVSQRDSRRLHIGDYMEPMSKISEKFEDWCENCAAYDADPTGEVYFSEEIEDDWNDFRITQWTGKFSGSWQGARTAYLRSPDHLSAKEAIE